MSAVVGLEKGSQMQRQVNIVVAVDVISALSGGTLLNGNLCMIDDGAFHSTGQGTSDLCTICQPGQLIGWTVLPLDLQTPVEIKNISFLGSGDGDDGPRRVDPGPMAGGRPALNVWSGVVPPFMAPDVPYNYRLELQLYEGEASMLHVDSPALKVSVTGVPPTEVVR